MFRGRAHSSDDDDEPSEATIQLNSKLTADFRKAFPLRNESARKVVPVATPSLTQISKRLNFDDSFSLPTVINPNVKILELKEEVDSFKTQLSSAQKEIERLKKAEMDGKSRCEQLLLEIVDLKKELIRRSHCTALDEARHELNEMMVHSRDEWQEAATRFHRYFQCAKARLSVAESEIRSRGLLNEDMKLALSSAWTSTEYRTESVHHENLRELLQNAAATLEELDKDVETNEGELDDDLAEESTQKSPIFDGDEACELSATDTAMIAEGEQGSNIFREPSPIPSFAAGEGNHSILSNMSESILNSTLANTSIDYEKDERIQRLELENSQLKDRVTVLFDRAQKSMLMEEKKNSAEQKYHLLERKMEEILGELNSLRSACAKKMFDVTDTTSQSRAAEIMKRIQDLNDKTENLQEELETTRSEADNARNHVESLTRERDTLLRKIDHLTKTTEDLRKSLADEKELCSSLSSSLEEKTSAMESLELELNSLRSQTKSLEYKLSEANEAMKNLEAQLQAAKGEPTDAGDETQILHLRNNPLQCAMDEFASDAERERQRKRKADETLSHGEPSEAKRAREEQIHALETQLKKSEREKEQALRLQADFAKKYREITTTLTGYQIKLKDIEEGICCVNSVYDEMEKQFVFKYNADTGIVDLLDVGQDVLSQGRPWEYEMQKYIGERHSIPGFLAAVTLQLESRRNLEEVERSDAFSVLHEK
ncbi:hypothetical protein Y032_0007g3297 [Ancylostoma ceylanicum]|uniref:Spindle assembly checkpoint component MAD1 n=2 Tax=Ancylostoma ceylanicum TaxID=53326 RepID=A0A016VPC5_9BILA|nr:hypothetical protein Y032_0007g3297 [Ancylostoma ceylanicum]